MELASRMGGTWSAAPFGHNIPLREESPQMAGETTSVLVVEDEPEFLRQYCEAITRDPACCLVGAVTTLAAAMALIEKLGARRAGGRPGPARRQRHRTDSQRCQRSVPTATPWSSRYSATTSTCVDAIAAGATGYLLKDSPPGELVALHPRAARRRRADQPEHRAAPARPHARARGASRRSAGGFAAHASAKPRFCELVAKGLELCRRQRRARHLGAHGGRPREEDLPQALRALARRGGVRGDPARPAALAARMTKFACLLLAVLALERPASGRRETPAGALRLS